MLDVILWVTFISFYLLCSVLDYQAVYVYHIKEYPGQNSHKTLRSIALTYAAFGPFSLFVIFTLGWLRHGLLLPE